MDIRWFALLLVGFTLNSDAQIKEKKMPVTVYSQKFVVKDKDGFILSWLVCGPFPNSLPNDKTDYGHHTKICWGYAHDFLKDYGGEVGIRPREGMMCRYGGKTLTWQKHLSSGRVVDFSQTFPPGTNSVAYAYCEVESPADIQGLIAVGSDAGVKVWLNHRLVLDHHVDRGVSLDEDCILVNFKKGSNLLLVKVDNDVNGWGFCLRTAATENARQEILLGDRFAAELIGRTSTDIRLPHVFGNHMVFQQEKPIIVWGWAPPGEKVTAEFQSEKRTAVANDRGEWKVIFPAAKAGGPYTLTVSGRNTIMLDDIMVGEVWLCSGQSNMEFGMMYVRNAQKEIAAANYPGIRLLKVPMRLKPATGSQPDMDTTWRACSPATVAEGSCGGFSAVAYFFGREIHQKLRVPVGLIQSAVSGTRIEPWTPPQGFADPEFATDESFKELYNESSLYDPVSGSYKERFDQELKNTEDWLTVSRKALNENKMPPLYRPVGRQPRYPSVCYNAEIYPLVPFPIRGAIWYQGECNWPDGMRYLDRMKALVYGWRQIWGEGDFPFFFVQIAPWNYEPKDPTVICQLWAAQAAAEKSIPNTAMALTVDIGDYGNIHPKNKQDVGHRLALLALAKTYGHKDLVCRGPTFKSMATEGDKIRVTFDNVGGGLVSRDGKPLNWFEIFNADTGKFVNAHAAIEGATVVLSATGVTHPNAVRFAWSKAAAPNLMNREGLPAMPFSVGQ
jgi:hypothetical protein